MTADPGSAHQDREAGFSLLEALVALALLSLAAALMPGALQLGMRAMHIGEPLARQASEGPARAFLASHLAAAEPVFRRAQDGTLSLDFDGGPDDVAFMAPAPFAARDQALVHYRLYYDAASRAVRVVLRRAPEPSAAVLQDGVLFPDAAGMSVRYFGRRARDEAAAWQDAWSGERVLPRLIEITIIETASKAAPGAPPSPPIVVPLHLSRAD